LPKCQDIGLLKTNQGNAPRVQLRLELLQHRGREIKCVDDLRLYAPLAERVQKGKGCCAEPGTGVEDAKPRTEKLGDSNAKAFLSIECASLFSSKCWK
jgi:hypothetical protein